MHKTRGLLFEPLCICYILLNEVFTWCSPPPRQNIGKNDQCFLSLRLWCLIMRDNFT